ncbi:hypothetical protein [Microbacterium sp. NPDC089188]|uniref:hypothetical protein n=1 Tax=Microbacterium sp. NPDC089188 TaxID=3154971 RepID=UPI003422A5EF
MYRTRGTFSQDLKDANTTLGAYLRSTFPNLKPIQADYKARADVLAVDSAGASPTMIGTAVDLIPRLIAEPEELPDSAAQLFPFNGGYHEELAALVALANDPDRETQARAAWGLALCVSAFRAGAAVAPRIPELVRAREFSASLMMTEAPPEAVGELTALRGLIEERLMSRLEPPTVFGPLFDLSRPGDGQRIAAEADLISDGTLVDVKSNLAPKTKAGDRPDVLKPEHVHQLLGYALLDYSDAYEIRRLAIYSARYGTLTDWPLDRVAETAAGRPVDLAAERQRVWDLMQEDIEFV